MALVLGTNCGFVTTAPTADPAETDAYGVDNGAKSFQVTTPSNADKITEIGWWCSNATEEADFEVGIYDESSNLPNNIVGSSSTTAKGTTEGWKKVTSLNIDISGSTNYWLAVQLDNTATTTNIDTNISSGDNQYKISQTNLPDPWDSSTASWSHTIAIYAVYTEAEDNPTISNISTITGVTSITI